MVTLLKRLTLLGKKELEAKYALAVFISFFILLISISSVYWINYNNMPNRHFVSQGEMDFSNSEGSQIKNIPLTGTWEFYPHMLIDAEKKQDLFHKYEGIKKYVRVPGSWNSYLNKDGNPEGSGTYRIIIKVPKDGVYGIRTKTIRVANRIFLNGEEVIHSGNPSLDRREFIPESKYKIAFIPSVNGEIELVVQVSSYSYHTGGIIKDIEFGTFHSIMDQNNKERAIDLFIVSICLLISVCFSILFFQKKRKPYIGYFSGICFFMALYLSTMNHQILDLIIKYDFIIRLRIQVVAMAMGTVFTLKFVQSFFYDEVNQKIMNKLVVIMAFMSLLSLFNPMKPISLQVETIQRILVIGMFVSFCYMSRCLIKAIYKKVDYIEYIIVIITTMFSYWSTMFIKILFDVNLGNMSYILILGIMFELVVLISYRLHQEYIEETKKEFQFFYSQISPHFLYNTLNTIIGLSYTDNSQVRKALNDLSIYLRGKLDVHRTKSLISLEDELELVMAYLDIEQMRYGEKLKVEYQIEEGLMAMIPPLTVQPLIENAVQHGIAPKEAGGVVRLQLKRRKNQTIQIVIEDDGVGIPLEKQDELLNERSERIGFTNVLKRVKKLKGVSFSLESTLGKGTKIQIFIPEVKYDESYID